jgi:hypothetical protein
VIALKDVQTAARDLIAGHAYFASENVIDDRGVSDPVIEKALRERGICVVVEPILAGKVTTHGGKIAVVDCEIFIQIQINPVINNGAKDIYLGISNIVAALTAPGPINPNDRFFLKPEGNAIQLSSFEPGLWAYDLTFTKVAVV